MDDETELVRYPFLGGPNPWRNLDRIVPYPPKPNSAANPVPRELSPTASRPHEVSPLGQPILNLPPELTAMIASYLPKESALAFSLTNRTLWKDYGPKYKSLELEETWRFLLLLEKDMPLHISCPDCMILHGATIRPDGLVEAGFKAKCAARNKQNRARLRQKLAHMHVEEPLWVREDKNHPVRKFFRHCTSWMVVRHSHARLLAKIYLSHGDTGYVDRLARSRVENIGRFRIYIHAKFRMVDGSLLGRFQSTLLVLADTLRNKSIKMDDLTLLTYHLTALRYCHHSRSIDKDQRRTLEWFADRRAMAHDDSRHGLRPVDDGLPRAPFHPLMCFHKDDVVKYQEVKSSAAGTPLVPLLDPVFPCIEGPGHLDLDPLDCCTECGTAGQTSIVEVGSLGRALTSVVWRDLGGVKGDDWMKWQPIRRWDFATWADKEAGFGDIPDLRSRIWEFAEAQCLSSEPNFHPSLDKQWTSTEIGPSIIKRLQEDFKDVSDVREPLEVRPTND